MGSMKLGQYVIGDPLSPYVIAEIGVNHGGSMELAKRLVIEAKEGGAHAVKFQSYKAETIAAKSSPAYWDTSKEPTSSQFELFKKFDSFGAKEYEELAAFCRTNGVAFLSTPFDLDAVDFLAPLMDAFKIASADITNVPLIRKCAQTGKPILLSTGAATLPEIEFALETARKAGGREFILLHCVLNYPTPPGNAALAEIRTLQRVFPECLVGYSDHVVPDAEICALQAAALLGACVLEKHFTHDKTLPGNDHYHAMDRADLKAFLEKMHLLRELIGKDGKNLANELAARRHARRSVVAKRSLRAGEILSPADLICKRPAHGISPIHWDEIIGRRVIVDIEEDSILQWEMLSFDQAK